MFGSLGVRETGRVLVMKQRIMEVARGLSRRGRRAFFALFTLL